MPKLEEIHIQPTGQVSQKMILDEPVFSHGSKKPIVEIELKPQSGGICTVAVWGDFHNANLCHDAELLKRTRDYILDNGIYVISPGTDPEAAFRNSKSDAWQYRQKADGQTMTPADEMEEQVELLKPIAERGLLLGVTDDNHGYRWQATTGKTFAEDLCRQLDCLNSYLGWQGFLNLKVASNTYRVFIYHGKSGATTPAGKMNASLRIGRHFQDADIYCTGHVHDAKAYDEAVMTSEGGFVHTDKCRLYVVAGSFLQYFGLYAERMLLSPGKMGAKLIQLHADEKYAECSVGGRM